MSSETDINIFSCYNSNCPDFGKTGEGNIFVKELRGKHQRALLMCKTCRKCFCETRGTPFFGLKTPMAEIAEVLALIPELGSIRAVARQTNHKADTIISWIDMINGNKKEINEYFINELHYTPNKMDEILDFINKRKRTNNNE